MHVNIKSHLKTEFITLLIAFIPAFFINMEMSNKAFPYITILIICAILGLVNTVYLFAHLCARHYFKTQSQVVLFVISWLFQWYVFIFISIPLIVYELILLCMGKTYIGKGDEDSCFPDKAVNLILTEKEKNLYDEFIKKYQKDNCLLIIILLAVFVFYYYLTTSLKNDNILLVIGLCLVFACSIILSIWRMKVTVFLMRDIIESIDDRCDSKTYYHICKALCEKYPRNVILAKHYFRSLQLDENDFSELKKALNHYRRYQRQCFYLIAFMDTLSLTEQIYFMNKHYEKIKRVYEKAYQKSGKIKLSNDLAYWEIRKCILEGQYTKALQLCDSIKDDGTKLGKVLYSYEKGICQFNLNQREEAEKAFAYVGTEGNTLRVKRLANMYLDDLHTN